MESLRIRTGVINLEILDDEGNNRGVFSFNPEDVESAKQVVLLQTEFEEKRVDFEERAKLCKDTEEKIVLLNEVVDYFREAIDRCFGSGSSELLFGKAKTLSMFEDFFNGITPYYQKASDERMTKYKKFNK